MPRAVRAFLVGLLVCVLVPRVADAVPPFSGTIFLDPDIIVASDPSAFTQLAYVGQGMRLMYDRRVGWVMLDAYLFDASFDGGANIEIQVNPEFGSAVAAELEAAVYAPVIGQLPAALRARVQTVWIHAGVELFGGGNDNLLIHTGQAAAYVADGILEEVLVHEAAHTSLDPLHAASPGWLAAQGDDGEFISTYARDFPDREDVAESFLPYLAVRYREGRITAALSQVIASTIPNRMAYFDSLALDLYPFAWCGNGVIDGAELCDDGNSVNGDGCDGNCTPSACGNGVLADGEVCDDGNLAGGDCCSASCQIEPAGSTCRPAVDACDAAEQCDGVSASCPADEMEPAGTPCPDGNLCNGEETCDGAGGCLAGTPPICDDGSGCTLDTCHPILGCQSAPGPTPGCAMTGKGLLLVHEQAAGREKLIAKYLESSATSQSDWGNPLTGGAGTAYELCIFDAQARLVAALRVDRAGETCAGRPCWKSVGGAPPLGKGYAYKDKDLTADGTLQLKLLGGSGRTKALWKAQNGSDTLPTGIASALGAAGLGPVTVQLHSLPAGSVCLSMELGDIKRNDGRVFKGKR